MHFLALWEEIHSFKCLHSNRKKIANQPLKIDTYRNYKKNKFKLNPNLAKETK